MSENETPKRPSDRAISEAIDVLLADNAVLREALNDLVHATAEDDGCTAATNDLAGALVRAESALSTPRPGGADLLERVKHEAGLVVSMARELRDGCRTLHPSSTIPLHLLFGLFASVEAIEGGRRVSEDETPKRPSDRALSEAIDMLLRWQREDRAKEERKEEDKDSE